MTHTMNFCAPALRPVLAAALALWALGLAPLHAAVNKTAAQQPSVLEPDSAQLSPAVRELLAKAQAGDLYAQNELGIHLALGKGAPKALAEAVRWWTMAAEKGMADAQFNLALAYDQGQGTEQNSAKAVELYEKAASQGNVPAMYNLAELLSIGASVP